MQAIPTSVASDGFFFPQRKTGLSDSLKVSVCVKRLLKTVTYCVFIIKHNFYSLLTFYNILKSVYCFIWMGRNSHEQEGIIYSVIKVKNSKSTR